MIEASDALLAHGAVQHSSGSRWELAVFALPVFLAVLITTLRGREDRRRATSNGAVLLTPPAFLTVRSAAAAAAVSLAETRPVAAGIEPRGLARAGIARIAVAASAVAALIHAWVAVEHLPGPGLLAVFFASVAVAQLAWSVVSPARSRLLLGLGLVANSALVGLWAVSRTVGLPAVSALSGREPVGALDPIATGCELVLIACVVQLMAAESRSSG